MPRELLARGWRIEIHDHHFARDTADEDWLKDVSARGWVVVTQDTKIRYRPAEKEAYLAAQARLFIVTSGGVTAEETVALLERVRDKLERIAGLEAGPFIYRVTKNGSVDRLA